MTRRLMAILLLTLSLTVTACEDDGDDPPPPDAYLSQTSEDNVLENFQRAYRMRDIQAYSRLLAADFQFYFDPATRSQLGIEFWTRTEDSLRTEQIFTSPKVSRVVIQLEWPQGSANGAGLPPPSQSWTKLFIQDVFLDVDFSPVVQEVTTFRVDGDLQRFFFRRGRTSPPSGPADTMVYIVEWRDEGAGSVGKTPLASEPTSWSRIKTLVKR